MHSCFAGLKQGKLGTALVKRFLIEEFQVRRPELSIDQYVDGVQAGNIAVLARSLTLVESSNPTHQLLAEELLTRLLTFPVQAIRVGITGGRGGKSTFIEALGLHLVALGASRGGVGG